MTEAKFDIYKVKYKTLVYGSATAVVAAAFHGDTKSILEKRLKEIKTVGGDESSGLKVLGIDRTGYKSDKEGVILVGINDK